MIFAAILFALGVVAIVAAGALGEVHHHYYGAALCALALWVAMPREAALACYGAGCALMVDEIGQHGCQAMERRAGIPPGGRTTSALHKLYERLVRAAR